jgi:aspartate aminotransferase
MTQPLSERLDAVRESSTMAVEDLARRLRAQGRTVVSLASGDPDFLTPAHIIEAGHAAMLAGDTHYPPARGNPRLIHAIVDDLKRRVGVTVTPNQVIATPGGKWAVYAALGALLNPGDEVLVLEPAWVSYKPMIELNGGVPIPVTLPSDDNYRVSEELLRAALTPRTKAILVNSPNNPTGRVFTADEVSAIAAVAVDADLYVISDEIYDQLTFDARSNPCLLADPRLADRTLLVNGCSKAYAMTGWRLGWLVAPEPVTKLALRLQSQALTSASSVTMAAGVAALEGPQECVADMAEEYEARRNFVVPRLVAAGLDCPSPEGAFYLFPRVPGGDDAAFAADLLEREGVAVVPGSAFGEAGRGHVRMTLAASRASLNSAMDGIDRYLAAQT